MSITERTGRAGSAIVALGSNLPWRGREPRAILEEVVDKLGALGAVRARSGFWRTQAWPDPSDPEFLNLCVRLETRLDPQVVMARLLELEAAWGRERTRPNAPRTLDLDLIDLDGCVHAFAESQAAPALKLPHPRMHERAFVLFPLRDVHAGWRHPELGRDVDELIAALPPAERRSVRREA